MSCHHRRRRTVFSQGVFWLLLTAALAAVWILSALR